MFRLDGKVAAVTGAGSGIGAAIARTYAAAGALVYVLDIAPEIGRATERAITVAGGRARFVPCDVSSEPNCAAAAAAVLAGDGRCDVLVNNAGIGHVGTALTTTPADLDRLYAVNVKGVLHMSQALLPDMLRRGGGSIINLASIGGVVGLRDRLAYCATKFAVVGLTRCMALDHAAAGVRVNCICPGRVNTPFVQARLREYPDPEAALAEMVSVHAIRRMAEPDEVAAAALYLASDAAAFVTGTAMVLDGGMTAGR